jgi:hypothetical protein
MQMEDIGKVVWQLQFRMTAVLESTKTLVATTDGRILLLRGLSHSIFEDRTLCAFS